MNTYSEIMEEIKQEILNGEELADIRERSHELADNYIPIYNGDVIDEWKAMPSDYDNRGSAELGHNCEELNIISLMQADLYLYYSDLVSSVLDGVEKELESVK